MFTTSQFAGDAIIEGIMNKPLTLVCAMLLSLGACANEFDDAFDEMDAQLESQYGAVAAEQEQQEYEQWKRQQNEEYEAYKKAYFEALNNYKRDILKYWDSAEVTDRTHWVEYSKDLQSKRVVDYESNEIRISVLDSNASSEKIQQLIEGSLKKMLAQTPNSARAEDPVLKAVGSDAAVADARSKQPVLSELITVDGASQMLSAERMTEKVAEKIAELKKQAVIGLPKPATEQSQPSASQVTQVKKKPPVVITIKLPNNAIARRAKKYSGLVESNAKKNKLDASLVYAIMHTESAFNPLARSYIPAYGLMQIVPGSAGRDVAVRLTGKDKIYSSEYLFDAGNNVQAGSTYINILYYSYLKGINDPLSRIYCVIAAYNTGAGNVAKTFTGKRRLKQALPIINGMNPQQVYNKLHNELPYEETREYLKRVVSRQKLYMNL